MTGKTLCKPNVDDSREPPVAQPAEGTSYWGLLGMLLIGGVIGGAFYMKGHLPPQVQAYLGGPLVKTMGGTEYEMVSTTERDERDSMGSSGRTLSADPRMKPASKSTYAQEATDDWDDDDGWDDDDDGWGDKWSEDMQ